MQLSEKQLIAKNASILAKEFMKHGGLVPPEGMITQSSIQSIETQAEWPFTDKESSWFTKQTSKDQESSCFTSLGF